MQYEYMVIQMAAGGRTTHLNERIEAMVAEGWEPCMMAGDTTLNVMMRRARPASTAPAQPASPPQPTG